MKPKIGAENETEKGESVMTNGFTWFFIGGVVGATVALLYAPKSGAELRSTIGNKAEDLIGQAKRKAEGIIRRGRNAAGAFKEELDRGRMEIPSGKSHPSATPVQ
jgi:gas vesicle protein